MELPIVILIIILGSVWVFLPDPDSDKEWNNFKEIISEIKSLKNRVRSWQAESNG